MNPADSWYHPMVNFGFPYEQAGNLKQDLYKMYARSMGMVEDVNMLRFPTNSMSWHKIEWL